jgi:hypothetical protein
MACTSASRSPLGRPLAIADQTKAGRTSALQQTGPAARRFGVLGLLGRPGC